MSATVNLQLSLDAESDPKRQFKMIDAWLREYERRNRDWPTLAKMCHEVKVKGLWKHGGYKDWSHWVLTAAPVCAKTVFVYVGTYEKLLPDFSDEELREMKPGNRQGDDQDFDRASEGSRHSGSRQEGEEGLRQDRSDPGPGTTHRRRRDSQVHLHGLAMGTDGGNVKVNL